MALLSRMVGVPLAIDIGPGAVAGPRAAARRPPDLQRRPRRDRGRARAGRGDRGGPAAAARERRHLDGRGRLGRGGDGPARAPALGLLRRRRRHRRRQDARHRQARRGASAASRWSRSRPRLAHDGIASPVSSLEEQRAQGVLRRADADRGRRRPRLRARERRRRCAARGSATSSPTCRRSRTGGWPRSERGEPVDGLAVTFARTAATALLHREDGIDDDDFLIALAEALVLSGLAMATAGSSRPCSGGDHEILHAIDHLYPGTAHHGELAGVGSLFTSWLRGDDKMARDIDACLTRHGLPRTPRDLGLDGRAVRPGRPPRARHAPGSLHDPRAPRPLRRRRWGTASARTQTPSIAELRAVAQPARIFERNSGEHWAGKLYVRRYSTYLTRLLLPTRVTPERGHRGDDRRRRAGGGAADRARAVPRDRRGAADPAPDPARLLRRRARALAQAVLARRASTSTASRHYLTETLLPIGLGIRADGGWDSIGGYTTLGLLAAVLALLVRTESRAGRGGALGGGQAGRRGHRRGGGAAGVGARAGAARARLLPVLPRLRGGRGVAARAGGGDRRLVRRTASRSRAGS